MLLYAVLFCIISIILGFYLHDPFRSLVTNAFARRESAGEDLLLNPAEATEDGSSSSSSSRPKEPEPVAREVTPVSVSLANNWHKHFHFPETTPEDLEPAWGSYRPGIYFGMKQSRSASSQLPISPITGIMWGNSLRKHDGLRHDTRQDELASFDWLMHDGRSFGRERMVDNKLNIIVNAAFVIPSLVPSSQSNDARIAWVQEITMKPAVKIQSSSHAADRNSLLFYVGLESASPSEPNLYNILKESFSIDKVIPSDGKNGQQYTFIGRAKQIGDFSLLVTLESESTGNELALSFMGRAGADMSIGTRYLEEQFRRHSDGEGDDSPSRQRDARVIYDSEGKFINEVDADSSFLAVLASGPAHESFKVTSILRVHSSPEEAEQYGLAKGEDREEKNISGSEDRKQVGQWMIAAEDYFHQRFRDTFRLDSKMTSDGVVEFSERDIVAAETALSSVLGGIGYYFGTPRIGDAIDVSSEAGKDPQNALESTPSTFEPISLLTGTPSRTAFPRGFLWDEGFHQMLISQWDTNLSLSIISDWFRGMYEYVGDDKGPDGRGWGGWIPREMILGEDASRRVPDEFVTQRVNIANPPTLLMVLESLLDRHAGAEHVDSTESSQVMSRLKTLYPYIHKWIHWFLTSQKGTPGDIPGIKGADNGFRWRGRSLADGKVLPNTLASGLDDYPRSAVPSEVERHVDLHAWMIKAVSVMERMANEFGGSVAGESLSFDAKQYYADKLRSFTDLIDALHWNEVVVDKTWLPNREWDSEEEEEEEDEGGKGGEADASKNIRTMQLYTDIGLQGEGDEIITGVIIRCGNMKTRQAVEVLSTPEAIRAIEAYKKEQFEIQQQVTKEGRKGGPKFQTPKAPEVCPAEYPVFMKVPTDEHGQVRTQERYIIGGRSGRRDNVQNAPIPRLGYVTIFPFLLKLVSPVDTPKLENLLDFIESPHMLWTPHGLRSMASVDPFYNRRNSPGDAPYWRGPIWININYLAIAALHHYSTEEGPSRERAQRLYSALRANVIRTVVGEYHRTGFFWEQYDDAEGVGIRGHPFSGWTALIVNIMAEVY